MATIEEIKELIKAEVNDRVKVDAIPANDNLSDHDIDSLDRSSIFMEIEDKYGITIPDTDMEKLNTLDDIVAYVNDNTK